MMDLYCLEDEGDFICYLDTFEKLAFPIERILVNGSKEFILNDLLKFFVEGLREEFRDYVSIFEPTILLEAMNLAVYFEKVIQHEDNDETDKDEESFPLVTLVHEKVVASCIPRLSIVVAEEHPITPPVHKEKFSNISEPTTEEDLSKVFGEFDQIISSVVVGEEDGKSKCFGFVNFLNLNEFAIAIQQELNVCSSNSVQIFEGPPPRPPPKPPPRPNHDVLDAKKSSSAKILALISQKIGGISTYQISNSLVRRKKMRSSQKIHCKILIDESTDFLSIYRERDCFILAVMWRSRSREQEKVRSRSSNRSMRVGGMEKDFKKILFSSMASSLTWYTSHYRFSADGLFLVHRCKFVSTVKIAIDVTAATQFVILKAADLEIHADSGSMEKLPSIFESSCVESVSEMKSMKISNMVTEKDSNFQISTQDEAYIDSAYEMTVLENGFELFSGVSDGDSSEYSFSCACRIFLEKSTGFTMYVACKKCIYRLQFSSSLCSPPQDEQHMQAQIMAYVGYFGLFISEQFPDNVAQLIQSWYPSNEKCLMNEVLATFVFHHQKHGHAIVHPIPSCIIDGTMVYDNHDPPLNSFIYLSSQNSEKEYSEQWAFACRKFLCVLTHYSRPIFKVEHHNGEEVKDLKLLVWRSQVLKRKLEEGSKVETLQAQRCRAKLDHVESSNVDKLNNWNDTSLKRILVDYMLRMSYYDFANKLAETWCAEKSLRLKNIKTCCCKMQR